MPACEHAPEHDHHTQTVKERGRTSLMICHTVAAAIGDTAGAAS